MFIVYYLHEVRTGEVVMLSELYRPSLALLTDLYQLTMICAAWKA